jgi:phosphoheptose isomerase
MTPETLSTVLRESARIQIQLAEKQAGAVVKVIDAWVAALGRSNTAFYLGNDGSAADSEHRAGDREDCTRIILASGTTIEPC